MSDAVIRTEGLTRSFEMGSTTVHALRGVDLVIERGEYVAIMGPSGSGKSSALALLQNFYKPSRGKVLLDGRPVTARSHAWLHRRIAMVGQEPVLFARSIAANVAYGLRTAPSDAKIAECLRAANAASFIDELPEKADTEVGERGAALSGGQKQRVAVRKSTSELGGPKFDFHTGASPSPARSVGIRPFYA